MQINFKPIIDALRATARDLIHRESPRHSSKVIHHPLPPPKSYQDFLYDMLPQMKAAVHKYIEQHDCPHTGKRSSTWALQYRAHGEAADALHYVGHALFSINATRISPLAIHEPLQSTLNLSAQHGSADTYETLMAPRDVKAAVTIGRYEMAILDYCDIVARILPHENRQYAEAVKMVARISSVPVKSKDLVNPRNTRLVL